MRIRTSIRVALTALLVVAAGSLVAAHLRVEKTSPASDAVLTVAPDHLQVWFSQAPTIPVSAITLEGPDGKVQTSKAAAGKEDDTPDKSVLVRIAGVLSPGRYTATWKTAGTDGHIQTGSFSFTYKPTP